MITKKLINPVPNPRYDNVFLEGLKMLNGVLHEECNYLAQIGTVCNKCGKLIEPKQIGR